jgi:drug/metabolite transporter (DMT)-like permease
MNDSQRRALAGAPSPLRAAPAENAASPVARTSGVGAGEAMPVATSSAGTPPRWLVLVAFAIIYVIWGSTYLAILFAIDTLPPFFMAGTRFLIAGALLYAWARLLGGATKPTRAEWRATAISGVLMLLVGNGAVVWSEFRVPSGVAALIVGVVPCCMVLVDWLRPGGTKPVAQVVLGLLLGSAGLFFLIGPESIMGSGRADLLGVAALVIGSFSWAVGSIYSRHATLPRSAFIATAMQMLAGGVALTIVAVLHGELAALDVSEFTLRSLAGWVYLIVFGSIVAFTAYAWLLRVSSPARVSTYAYVNPIVAVLLGWTFAGEALTARMIVAAAVIVSGVALITLAPRPRANAS